MIKVKWRYFFEVMFFSLVIIIFSFTLCDSNTNPTIEREVIFLPIPPIPQIQSAKELNEAKTKSQITTFILATNPSLGDLLASQMAETYLLAARKYDIDVKLLVAKDWVESRFNPRATSKDKYGEPLARGVAQFTAPTGRAVWQQLGIQWNGPESLYNPLDSIIAGAYYLRHLIDLYGGNVKYALEAYNMGPTRLSDFQKRGVSINYNYALKVEETRGGLL